MFEWLKCIIAYIPWFTVFALLTLIPASVIAWITWKKYKLSHIGLLKVEVCLINWIDQIYNRVEQKFGLIVSNYGQTTIKPNFLGIHPYKGKVYKSRRHPLLTDVPGLRRPLSAGDDPIRLNLHEYFTAQFFTETIKIRSIFVTDTLERKWYASRKSVRKLRRQLKRYAARQIAS